MSLMISLVHPCLIKVLSSLFMVLFGGNVWSLIVMVNKKDLREFFFFYLSDN